MASRPRAGGSLTFGTLFGAALAVLAVIAAALLLRALLEIVLIFLIAVILAEGLRPLVRALNSRGVPEILARAAVYLALIGIVIGLLSILARPVALQAQGVLENLPRYESSISSNLDSALQSLNLQIDVRAEVSSSLGTISGFLLKAGETVVRALVDTLAVLLMSFLWLGTSARLGAFTIRLLPPRHERLAREVLASIGSAFGGYVRGVAINMVVIGVVSGVAASLLDLPAPVLLGLFMGLTEMIPIVGPIIGATPAVLLGFTVSPVYPLLVAAVYLVIQELEAHTLVPLLMRQAVGLPALGVVLALLVGAALGGVAGAIVAVPVASALQIVTLRVVAPALRERWGAAA
ncbi:MAG TPA: AI-2E family transporter [Candidatus Acidoferrales bacterium]|nr:AI-2E family transporter [Candidatus Acidoferrales bacterium]